jgi:hypothetical protein
MVVSPIDGKLAAARRRLLDLSQRNRLLNFRAGRATGPAAESKGGGDATASVKRRVDRQSLAMNGASPSTVYQHLVRDERTLEFEHAENAPQHDQERLFGTESDNGDSQVSSTTSSRSQIRLQTTLTEDQLDNRLLFLAREAESALQEQGCNVLYLALGLLDWVDPQSEGDASCAPLVLVPVELIRRDANQRFRMRLFDDAPIVNPTLTQFCRTNFRIDVPQLDPESEAPIDDLFGALEQQIRKAKGWTLRREVHLGLFSFAKLLMYLDLDSSRWPEGASITAHPLVQAMCGIQVELECLGADCDTTPADELDEKVAPQDTFQVMDADSSQQVAILAAKRGSSMVVEGPPGTGKSQTIANIIAECLAAGKTVLFVAEKSAALDVVKRRLDGVGLGDFVLELHSRKAAKRKILEELDRTMRAVYPPAPSAAPDAAELQRVRNRLNEYVKTLHSEVPPLQMSLFQAMGQCAQLISAPESRFTLTDISSWDRARLATVVKQITLLARAASRVGSPETHPWRGVGLSEVPLVTQQQLPDQLANLRDSIQKAIAAGNELAQFLQATPSRCRKDAQQIIDLAKAILDAPQVTAEAAENRAWDSCPADVDAAIQSGRRLLTVRADLALRWKPSAEETDWSEVLQRRTQQSKSLLRWVSPSWHRDTRSIRQHLLDGMNSHDSRLTSDLASFAELRQCRATIESAAPRCKSLFDALWLGEGSNWEAIASFAQAAVAIRGLILAGRFTADGARRACSDGGRLDLKRIARLFAGACNDMLAKRQQLAKALALEMNRFLGGDPEATSFDVWSARLAECEKAVEALQDWIDYNRYVGNCLQFGIGSFLSWCAGPGMQVGVDKWPPAFRRQFVRLWLDKQLQSAARFRDFQGDALDQLVDQFRRADKRWLELGRSRLTSLVAARRPDKTLAAEKNSKLGILKAELHRKRNIKPLRQLFSLAGDVIQALKPCIMMSPLSTAQYLEPGKLAFDVVIFDEASQVEPADALGAIARGRQLILVGDDKQLPPTAFFGSVNMVAEEEEDEDGVKTDDLESILAVGKTCFPARSQTRLRWHYRSRHSSLIAFSNSEFYDGELRVFPSPHLLRDEFGLSFRHLPDAVYQRGKDQSNPIEAKEVAKQVLAHAKASPNKSLGVGAFSQAQQRAIEDVIETLRKTTHDPAIEAFFGANEHEPFFVKNLETIQGDERDVIYLSVGYGPDESGKVTMNFGPLNREGGWRRLNVLITRAREKCIVFSSLTAGQMRLGPDAPRGVKALKDFLQFAEFGTLPTISGYCNDHDSPFEADVCRVLRDHGWEVHAQVGCAGFSIDLAVVDPREPGRYLIGIECDGATYHSAATARDRDRLRQSVLEGLGWKFHRIWSTDWFARRQATAARLLARVKELADSRGSVTPDGTTPPDAREAMPPPKLFDVGGGQAVTSVGKADGQNRTVGNQVASATESASGPPTGFIPYERYAGAARGSRQSLLVSTTNEVIEVMAEIVHVEGPIHFDELYRVVASLYQARVVGQVKHLLETALESGVRHQQFVERGEFIWPLRMDRAPARWRGADDAVTDPTLICPEEVAEAAVCVSKNQFGIPLDDLPAATLRAMGFKRIGPHLSALGTAGIELAIKGRRIVADPGGFMIVSAEPDKAPGM